jgi:predicted phage terminase large subunit-like protein
MPTSAAFRPTADDLAGLEGPELARALEIAAKLYGGEPLADFTRRVRPDKPPPRHVLPFMEKLQEARYRPLRLVVEMPPRHVKTTTIHHAMAWWMHQFPGDLNGYFTYSDRKAWSESRKMRALALGSGIELSDEASSVAEWRTKEGGGLLAGGAGAGLTGYGMSGLMVVDDPYKNRKEANSAVIRDSHWEWFNEVVFTRDEGCSIIVMHTRWHEKDMIGMLLGQGWEEIRLPAIAEEGDILGRAVGEALWPDRYHLARLERIRKQIGEYAWAALYQQRPRPKGQKLFGPEHYYDPATVDFEGCRAGIGADTAGTKKTASNSSAAVAAMIRGRGEKKTAYIIDARKQQTTVPVFARDLRAFQAKNHGAQAAVEVNGIGRGTYQVIKDVDAEARVVPVTTVADKFSRFQGPAAAWNDARILLPLGSDEAYPWRKQFINDVQEVTGLDDPEDDYADAMTMMWDNDTAPPELEDWGGVLPRRT